MSILIKLSEEEINEIQKRYFHLINYESGDPNSPIDPITYVDSNGDHLIHIAAQQEDLQTIKLLLRSGVDVDKRGDMGCTALHYAKNKKNTEVINFLLESGASIGSINDFGNLPE